RPRAPMGNVRLVEVGESGITVNGEPVSGPELRQRLGADADLVLRLSYLSPDDRRAVASPRSLGAGSETPQPPAAAPAASTESTHVRLRRSNGDRVRVFGNVRVDENEEVTGQVVAVMGSVHVDGTVGNQGVVAVLGSVDLGPHAVVEGDIVT